VHQGEGPIYIKFILEFFGNFFAIFWGIIFFGLFFVSFISFCVAFWLVAFGCGVGGVGVGGLTRAKPGNCTSV
jgi:hypothetical protein